MGLIKKFLYRFASQIIGRQIQQHQMIIRAIGNNLNISLLQPFAERLRIINHTLLVFLERRI